MRNSQNGVSSLCGGVDASAVVQCGSSVRVSGGWAGESHRV